ncbi:MAG: hypothetical protein K0S05_15 [Agromyces sp.]|jgi:ABC-type nitrate/sulfonate/bicarbonate transport system substrate-binding protein|nr:hypothetical protein [Agromyces sp.]
MTLHLSYFVPPPPHVAARERGLLDGIEVIESRAAGSPAQLAGLLAGELDVVVTAIDNLFEWTRDGADVRLVAQVERTTPLGVFVGSGVESLRELHGRRFAVDAVANGFALVARYLLLQAKADVDYLEIGGVQQRYDALLAGAADATLLGPPFDHLARAAGKHELVSVQEEFPAFPGQGLVVRGDLVADDELSRYLSALWQGGLVEVEPAGLDTLTGIRDELGLLPEGADLRALLMRPIS